MAERHVSETSRDEAVMSSADTIMTSGLETSSTRQDITQLVLDDVNMTHGAVQVHRVIQSEYNIIRNIEDTHCLQSNL